MEETPDKVYFQLKMHDVLAEVKDERNVSVHL